MTFVLFLQRIYLTLQFNDIESVKVEKSLKDKPELVLNGWTPDEVRLECPRVRAKLPASNIMLFI